MIKVFQICILFQLCIHVSTNIYAQKPREAAATYTMVLSRTSTMQETETLCIEQARLKAIADAFGYSISETTVGSVSDQNGKVNDAFNVLTKTSVKGEWISDTAPPKLEWKCENNELSVTAFVSGKIRENSKEGKTEVEFYPCLPSDYRIETVSFRSGQTLNTFFRSARKGYLSVFYVDHTTSEAYRVFPSPAYSSLDHLEVNADQDYVLFNRSYASQFAGYPATVDLTMELPADKSQVLDEIVAVYSPEPYKKPMLSKPSGENPLPKLRFDEFNDWITNLKSLNNQAVIKSVSLPVIK
jgi:hypothetical protein